MEGIVMNKHPASWTLLVLAVALVAACQDRREPVKPTVVPAAQAAPLAR